MFTEPHRILLAAVAVLIASALYVVAGNNGGVSAGSTATTGSSTATVQLITPQDYQARFVGGDETHLLIDVRTPGEFVSGHIAGAINIPVQELAHRLSEVPQGQPLVIYCRSGNRTQLAGRILAQAGYSAIYDLGGLNRWAAQGFPVQ